MPDLNDVAQSIEEINYSVDILFVVLCGALVVFMQGGFVLVEVGSVRNINRITNQVLSTNTLDTCIGTIMYWFIGHSFAYGSGAQFIGWNEPLARENNKGNPRFLTRPYDGYGWVFFFFQLGFVNTVLAIISGAVAERVQQTMHFINISIVALFVYPVAAHWIWSGTGWASPGLAEENRLFGVGAIDFAGCAVVHMVGGIYGFVGTFFIGPRVGRFDEHGKPSKVQSQSLTLSTLGVLILWFGWYGFNCGSVLGIEGAYADVVGKSAITTTLSAGAGGVTTAILSRFTEGQISINAINNGILAGLVSITSGCAVVQVWSAFLIGIIGGAIEFFSAKALVKMHIDDVVDASPVHLCCGMWGVISAALFAETNNVSLMYDTGSCGLFYGCGKGWAQLGANVVFMLAVIAWAGAMSFIFYGFTSYMRILRVDANLECEGLHDHNVDYVNGKVRYENQVNALKWSLLGRLFESYAVPRDMSKEVEDVSELPELEIVEGEVKPQRNHRDSIFSVGSCKLSP